MVDSIQMQVKGLFGHLKVEYTAIELDEVGEILTACDKAACCCIASNS